MSKTFQVGSRARISTDKVVLAKLIIPIDYMGIECTILEGPNPSRVYPDYYKVRMDKEVFGRFETLTDPNSLEEIPVVKPTLTGWYADLQDSLHTRAFASIKKCMKNSEADSNLHKKATTAYQRWGYLNLEELEQWSVQ